MNVDQTLQNSNETKSMPHAFHPFEMAQVEIEGRKSRTSEGRVEGLLGRRSYYPRFVTARIQVLAWSSSGVGVVACMGGVWYNPGLVNFHFGEGARRQDAGCYLSAP